MTWNWPQITWAIFLAIGLLVAAANDGEPKKGKYSFSITFVAAGITAFLLWQGGFWAGAHP